MYVRGGIKKILEKIEKWIEEEKGIKTLIEGDFNARIERKGGSRNGVSNVHEHCYSFLSLS